MPEHNFYTVGFGRCDICNKPATKEIRGPYNAKYGTLCSNPSCEKRKLTRLIEAHSRIPAEEMPRT